MGLINSSKHSLAAVLLVGWENTAELDTVDILTVLSSAAILSARLRIGGEATEAVPTDVDAMVEVVVQAEDSVEDNAVSTDDIEATAAEVAIPNKQIKEK